MATIVPFGWYVVSLIHQSYYMSMALRHNQIGSTFALARHKPKNTLPFLNPAAVAITMGIKAGLINVDQVLKAHHGVPMRK